MTDLVHDSPQLRRRVAVSASAQVGAKTLHVLLNIVSTLVIIRYLGPASYGNFVLVLTLTMLIGLIADFGLVKLATREVARELHSEDEVLGTVLLARLCLAAACVGLLQLSLFGLGEPASVHWAGLVASVAYFGSALMVASVAFYVRVKQQYEAVIQVCMEAFETTFIVVLVARHASLPALFVPPSVAALAGGTAALLIARRRFGVRFRLALARLPYLMKEALPLGPALLISVCYLKLDILMLAILRTPREVGLYGSAYQPIEYTFLAAAVVVNVAFPLAAAAFAAGDHERFAHVYRRGAEILLTVMVLVPVLLWFIAVPLVVKVYGPAYRDAARPLQLLSVALVLMTLNAWQAFVLLAGGRQKVTLYYNLGALAVSAIACSLLVVAYGMIGAAVATLCTGVFVLLCSTFALRRYLDLHLAPASVARILAAAGAMWATLWTLQRVGTPWPALVPAVLIAYPAWLLALRVVRWSTLRTWSLSDDALYVGRWRWASIFVAMPLIGVMALALGNFGSKALYLLIGVTAAAVGLWSIRDLLGPPMDDAMTRMKAKPNGTKALGRIRTALGILASALGAALIAFGAASASSKVLYALVALLVLGAGLWLGWPAIQTLFETDRMVYLPRPLPASAGAEGDPYATPAQPLGPEFDDERGEDIALSTSAVPVSSVHPLAALGRDSVDWNGAPTPPHSARTTAVGAGTAREGRTGRALGMMAAAFAAGVIAFGAGTMGSKALLVLAGGVIVIGCLVRTRDKSLFTVFGTVCALAFLVHKTIGPLDSVDAGGAPSVYITSFDAMVVLLYALWMSEGTFLQDVRAAWHRRILWIPAIGMLLMLPSTLAGGASLSHAIAELVRMAWMYLLFFYIAVRVRSRSMVWAILAGFAAFAIVEIIVVILQWKTGGVLGLSFLGVPTHLSSRVTDSTQLGRPFGTITHPDFMGAAMGSLAMVGFALVLTLKRSLVKVLAFVLSLGCVLCLYLAHTRAALVAFIVVTVAMVVVGLVHRRIQWRAVGWAMVVVLIAGAVFFPQLEARFKDNFGTGHFGEEVASRYQLNDVAGQVFFAHPLLGVGLNDFQGQMGPYETHGVIFIDNPVQNFYLLNLSETGIVGTAGVLLVGIAMYDVALRLARSRDRLFGAIGIGVSAAMAFLMIEELLGVSLRQDVPLAVYWTLAGLAVACYHMSGLEGRRRPIPPPQNARWDRPPASGVDSAGVRRTLAGVGSENGSRGSRHNGLFATRGTGPWSPRRAPALVPIRLAPVFAFALVRYVQFVGARIRAAISTSLQGVGTAVVTGWGQLDSMLRPGLAATALWPVRFPEQSPAVRDDVVQVGGGAPGSRARAQLARRVPRCRVPGRPHLRASTPRAWRRRSAGGKGRSGGRWRAAVVAGSAGMLALTGLITTGDGVPSGAQGVDAISQLRVVYAARTDNGGGFPAMNGIFVSNADGTDTKTLLLSNSRTIYNWPQWALGGTKIIFTVRDGPPISSQDPFPAYENIFEMNPDGSDKIQLTNYKFRALQPKVSPDGRYVLFTGQNPQYPYDAIYKLDLLTLQATNLSQFTQPDGAVNADPKFTPDGNIVITHSGTGAPGTALEIMSPDGSSRQTLLDDTHFNTDAEFSPDGTKYAYSGFDGSNPLAPGAVANPQDPDDVPLNPVGWFITVRDPTTGASVVLNKGEECASTVYTCAPSDSSGWKPVWSPDGSTIAWAGRLNRTTTCICAANADGTDPRVLIQNDQMVIKWFDWTAPGGSAPSTAIPDDLIGSQRPTSQLLISGQDMRTRTPELLTEPPDMMGDDTLTTAQGSNPTQGSWTTDRSESVFVATASYDPNNPQYGPPPPPGQQVHEHFTLQELQPALSPRYPPDDISPSQQVFLRRADGTVVQLTTPWTEDWRDAINTGDLRSNTDPVISPDGRYVVFTSHSNLTNESFLLRMDLTTGEVLSLTNGTAGAMQVNDNLASWSPDSSKIAFTWTDGQFTDVNVLNASDGTSVRAITDDGAYDMNPTWSPDGQSIVYSHYDGTLQPTPGQLDTMVALPKSGWSLVKVDVSTGRETVLTTPTDSPTWRPVYSPDGQHIDFIGWQNSLPNVFQTTPAGERVTPVLITPFLMVTSLDWK